MKLKDIEKLILNTYKQTNSKRVKTGKLILVSFATVVFPLMVVFNNYFGSLALICFLGTYLLGVNSLSYLLIKNQIKKLSTIVDILMKKLKNYEVVLNNDLLGNKSVDIVNIYEMLKINEIVIKNQKYLWSLCNYDDILDKIKGINETYQNYILQNNPKEFEVQVNCNFGDISVLYCSEKNIVDLLTYEGFDIFDMIDNRISYQNDLMKKNLHKSLSLNNIKYVESVFNEFPDKQKKIIDFLISVKGGVFDKNQSAIIKKILGSPMYDIFEKNNTIDRCTHDSIILLQLSDTVAFIVNNLEKLPQKAKIDFDFIKKDYEKAQSLDLLKKEECINIFKSKFNDFVTLIQNNQKDDYKKEQSKFMKYLSKAL